MIYLYNKNILTLILFCVIFICFNDTVKAQKTVSEYIFESADLKKKIRKLEQDVRDAEGKNKSTEKITENLTSLTTQLINLQKDYKKLLDENNKIKKKYTDAVNKSKELEYLRGKDAEAIKQYENLLNQYRTSRKNDSIAIATKQQEASAIYEKNIASCELRILQKSGKQKDMIVVEEGNAYASNKIESIFIFIPSFLDPEIIYNYEITLDNKFIEGDEVKIDESNGLPIVSIMEGIDMSKSKGKYIITIFHEKGNVQRPDKVIYKTFSITIK